MLKAPQTAEVTPEVIAPIAPKNEVIDQTPKPVIEAAPVVAAQHEFHVIQGWEK